MSNETVNNLFKSIITLISIWFGYSLVKVDAKVDNLAKSARSIEASMASFHPGGSP